MWDFCFKLMKIRVKTISVTTACYNEEGNVEELCQRVRAVMASIGRDNYEHIFIDNASRPTPSNGTTSTLTIHPAFHRTRQQPIWQGRRTRASFVRPTPVRPEPWATRNGFPELQTAWTPFASYSLSACPLQDAEPFRDYAAHVF
jgi:hypothetical protein